MIYKHTTGHLSLLHFDCVLKVAKFQLAKNIAIINALTNIYSALTHRRWRFLCKYKNYFCLKIDWSEDFHLHYPNIIFTTQATIHANATL